MPLKRAQGSHWASRIGSLFLVNQVRFVPQAYGLIGNCLERSYRRGSRSCNWDRRCLHFSCRLLRPDLVTSVRLMSTLVNLVKLHILSTLDGWTNQILPLCLAHIFLSAEECKALYPNWFLKPSCVCSAFVCCLASHSVFLSVLETVFLIAGELLEQKMSRQENHAWIYRVCLRYEKTERSEIREKYNESDLNVSAMNWDCGVLYITALRYTPSDRCRSRENSIAFTVKRDSGVEVYNLSAGAMLAPRFSLVRGSHWPRNPSSCISTTMLAPVLLILLVIRNVGLLYGSSTNVFSLIFHRVRWLWHRTWSIRDKTTNKRSAMANAFFFWLNFRLLDRNGHILDSRSKSSDCTLLRLFQVLYTSTQILRFRCDASTSWFMRIESFSEQLRNVQRIGTGWNHG